MITAAVMKELISWHEYFVETQLPQSLWRFAWNFLETVRLHKISAPEN